MPATSRTFSTSSSSRPAGRGLSLVETTLGAEATALVCPMLSCAIAIMLMLIKVVKSSDDSFCTFPSMWQVRKLVFYLPYSEPKPASYELAI
jgi:hypothetical protein